MNSKLRWLANSFWLVYFLSSFFMLFEILIFKARQEGNIFSLWILLATIHVLLVVESEIYFFNFLYRTKLWQEKVLPHWRKVFKNNKRNNGDWSDHQMAHTIRRLEYLGLVISTMFVSMSKVGAFIFVADRAKLPYGRIFLYGGCLLRIPFEYGIWTGIFKIRDMLL